MITVCVRYVTRYVLYGTQTVIMDLLCPLDLPALGGSPVATH